MRFFLILCQKIQKLEASLVGKDLDLEVAKADNSHILQQLSDKDKLIKEWVETAEKWEAKILKLQKENKQLKDSLAKAGKN